MPEEPRSTALDPDLLTAEIGLLLDYLSGLPERILTSSQRGHLPPGCATYDKALARYFLIDEKVRRGETLPPSDLQFLLEMRDYLNACAEPATGASVAFTTLVMRKLPEARKGKADAERAYPEWVPMARALSRAMMIMLGLAVIITLSIATLAAYIYLGNAKVANLTDIKAQFKSLDEEIFREEAGTNRSSKTAVLSYCADVEVVQDPVNPEACERVSHHCPIASMRPIQRFAAKTGPSLRESVAALVPARRSALPAQLNVVSGTAACPDGPARFNDLRSAALSAQRRRSSPYPSRPARIHRTSRARHECLEWRSAFSPAPTATLPSRSLSIPPAHSGHRRWRSSPATASKPYSRCSMAWRSSSPPRGSEAVFHKLA